MCTGFFPSRRVISVLTRRTPSSDAIMSSGIEMGMGISKSRTTVTSGCIASTWTERGGIFIIPSPSGGIGLLGTCTPGNGIGGAGMRIGAHFLLVITTDTAALLSHMMVAPTTAAATRNIATAAAIFFFRFCVGIGVSVCLFINPMRDHTIKCSRLEQSDGA